MVWYELIFSFYNNTSLFTTTSFSFTYRNESDIHDMTVIIFGLIHIVMHMFSPSLCRVFDGFPADFSVDFVHLPVQDAQEFRPGVLH